MRIAVIGGGIAGMGAAWLLNQRHDIALYEAEPRLGGHSNTVDVATAEGPLPVDTGFIVYNDTNYPNLVQLFAHLGVETLGTDMSFAVSMDQGRFEYSGGTLTGLVGQWQNLFRPAFYKMIAEILRFYREAPALLDRPDAEQPTLGAFLTAGGYGQRFIDEHILPMGAAIWSCSVKDMLDFPAASFIRFCRNHGLLKVTGRPQWRTVKGGSRAYVEKLTRPYANRARLGVPVASVRRGADGIAVIDRNGHADRFDQVVFACHGDTTRAILADPSPEEAAILGAFRYQPNRAVLHRDRALMPKRRAVWSAWNYLAETGGDRSAAVAVTYWMNRLQVLPAAAPELFVTLNPTTEPDPALVERSFIYDHPLFDHDAVAAQGRLASIQGQGGLWYCGSYCGWGFHEDGLAAGLAVARALGCEAPWPVAPAHAARSIRLPEEAGLSIGQGLAAA